MDTKINRRSFLILLGAATAALRSRPAQANPQPIPCTPPQSPLCTFSVFHKTPPATPRTAAITYMVMEEL